MDYLESNSTTSNTVENPECDTKTIQNVTQIIEKVHDEIKTTQEDVHHEFKKLKYLETLPKHVQDSMSLTKQIQDTCLFLKNQTQQIQQNLTTIRENITEDLTEILAEKQYVSLSNKFSIKSVDKNQLYALRQNMHEITDLLFSGGLHYLDTQEVIQQFEQEKMLFLREKQQKQDDFAKKENLLQFQEEKIAVLMVQIDHEKHEKIQLEQQVQAMRQQLAQLEKQLGEIKTVEQAQSLQICHLQTEVEVLFQEKKGLDQAQEKQQKDLAACHKILEEKDKKIYALKAESESQAEENEGLKQQIKTFNQERDQERITVTNQLQNAQETITELIEERDALRTELNNIKMLPAPLEAMLTFDSNHSDGMQGADPVITKEMTEKAPINPFEQD